MAIIETEEISEAHKARIAESLECAEFIDKEAMAV